MPPEGLGRFGLLSQVPQTERQKFISHSSGGWKSDMRVQAQLGSGESPLPGHRWPSSHCVLTWHKDSDLALCTLLRRALTLCMKAPPHDLITSHRPTSLFHHTGA